MSTAYENWKLEGLGPKDKKPTSHGWGKDFPHTEPQRHVPTIAGEMLAPLSADDIAPVSAQAMASVDAALDLLARLLGDRDHWLYMGAGDNRAKEQAAEVMAIKRIQRGLHGILRVERPARGKLYVWCIAATLDTGEGCQAIGFMESGQILIQSRIYLGTDLQMRMAAVGEITDWLRKHRPGEWDVKDDSTKVWPCPFDARKMIAGVVR